MLASLSWMQLQQGKFALAFPGKRRKLVCVWGKQGSIGWEAFGWESRWQTVLWVNGQGVGDRARILHLYWILTHFHTAWCSPLLFAHP